VVALHLCLAPVAHAGRQRQRGREHERLAHV
jgi:hypothetical protein